VTPMTTEGTQATVVLETLFERPVSPRLAELE
jgi:hypothetical protein